MRREFGTIMDHRGRWVARYRLGKKLFEKGFPHTRDGKRNARRWLTEQQLELLQSGKKDIEAGAGAGFRKFCRKFMPHYQAKVRPRTWECVRHHLEEAIAHFGKTPLRQIRRHDARAFLIKIQKKRDLKASTIERYAASLSAVFRDALDHDLVESNPFRGLRLGKPDGVTRDWLQWSEIDELLEHVPIEISWFVDLVAETGCRLSEAARLTWGDVRPDRIFVRAHIAKSHRERTVPLTQRARMVLAEIRSGLDFARDEEPVFPYGPDFYSRHFTRAMRKAGISTSARKITIHSLRHAAGSRIANDPRIPLHIAQEWLGHADIKTTRIYVHAQPDALLSAAKLLDESALSDAARTEPTGS